MGSPSENKKRRWRRRHLIELVVAIAALALVATAGAYVGTDQDDYSPGSVVTISGGNDSTTGEPGYVEGERVDVLVDGPNGWTADCDTVVAADGTWSCEVILSDDPSIASGAYTYTAHSKDANGDAITEEGSFTDSRTVTKLELSTDGGGTFTDVTSSGSVTVAPGATVTVRLTVNVTSTSTWACTNARIGDSGAYTEDDFEPDHTASGSPHTEVFDLTAPGTTGSYSVNGQATYNDNCDDGISGDFSFANRVVVSSGGGGVETCSIPTTYVDFATGETGNTAASSITIPRPDPVQVGDVLIAGITIGNDNRPITAPAPPSGGASWVGIEDTPVDGGSGDRDLTLSSFYKVITTAAQATAENGVASYQFTWTGGNEFAGGGITLYRGVDTTTPIGDSDEWSSGSTLSYVRAPGVNTTKQNQLVVALWAVSNDKTLDTSGISVNERYEVEADSDDGPTIAGGDFVQATYDGTSADDTPNKDAVISSDGHGKAGQQIALNCTEDSGPTTGTLTVTKVLAAASGKTNPITDKTQFSFKVDDGSATAFEADGSNDVTVDANDGTSVTEVAKAGYQTTYSNTLNSDEDCDDLDVPAGGTATCTITNTFVGYDTSTSSTLTSQSFTIGNSVTDTAEVTNTDGTGDPTGSVTFYLCGPADPAGASPDCSSGGTTLGTDSTPTDAGTDKSSFSYGPFTPTAAGKYCIRAVYNDDATFNTSSDYDASECFTVNPASATVVYTGDEEDANGPPTLLRATVTSSYQPCVIDRQVTFDLNGVTMNYTFTQTTSAPTSGTYTRTASTSKTLAYDVYDLVASVANKDLGSDGIPECSSASDTGNVVLTVTEPGSAAHGGGWYKADGSVVSLNGTPRINFGFTVKRQKDGTYKGQILWKHQNHNRLKGTLDYYGVIDCPTTGGPYQQCGIVSGTGTLYDWNSATETWDNPRTVSFIATLYDGGLQPCTKKKCQQQERPDWFGMKILDEDVQGESTAPIQLSGGSIKAGDAA